MRRIFVLLAVLALSSIACADPTADSLSVSSASGDPGDTDVLVLINITNVVDGPIQVIMFNVTYDSGVIELANAGRGFDLPKDSYGDATWTATLGTNKKSVTLAANKKDCALPNGTTGNIAKLYFNVNATAIPGQASTIGLSDMDLVNTEYVHGTIPVNDGTFAVNGTVVDPVLCTYPDPPSNDFGNVPAGETRTWTFDVSNSGAGTLDWTVVDDQDWITVSPESGSDAGTVTLTIDTTGLIDGAHTGTITVDSSYGTRTGTIDVNVNSGAQTTSVSIADITAASGDVVTVPLMVNDMTDFGTATINITYDPLVVHVTNITDSSDSVIAAFNNNNAAGFTAISASNTGGASGDIVFANVEFTAVGSDGDSTLLSLTIDSLYDRSFNAISATIGDGSFTIQSSTDPAPHLTTYTISGTEIDVAFSEPVDAAILIGNATGVVRTLYTGSGVTDPDPQVWDETDDSGNPVADGMYQVNITMDDGVNQVVYDASKSILITEAALISIGDGCGIVTIPIEIGNGADVGACDIMLSYDPAIVNVTGVTDRDMDVTVANLEHAGDGWVRIGTYQTDNPGLSGQITFANVAFEPVGGSGNCSLNLSVATFKDATPEGNEMPYVLSNGTYTALLNGDVNGDGVVDMHDAMYLAKHVLGKSGFEVIITEAADVNDDKVIDIADSMHIAKYVLGITGFELR